MTLAAGAEKTESIRTERGSVPDFEPVRHEFKAVSKNILLVTESALHNKFPVVLADRQIFDFNSSVMGVYEGKKMTAVPFSKLDKDFVAERRQKLAELTT